MGKDETHRNAQRKIIIKQVVNRRYGEIFIMCSEGGVFFVHFYYSQEILKDEQKEQSKTKESMQNNKKQDAAPDNDEGR